MSVLFLLLVYSIKEYPGKQDSRLYRVCGDIVGEKARYTVLLKYCQSKKHFTILMNENVEKSTILLEQWCLIRMFPVFSYTSLKVKIDDKNLYVQPKPEFPFKILRLREMAVFKISIISNYEGLLIIYNFQERVFIMLKSGLHCTAQRLTDLQFP